MNRRKIDIHKYFPVRRILFQFVDGKVHLIGSTVLIRATESRQPITLIEIVGKYPSYIIPLTEKVDSSDADCFITYLSQTLYERSLFESITAFGRYTSRTGLKGEKEPLSVTQHMRLGG